MITLEEFRREYEPSLPEELLEPDCLSTFEGESVAVAGEVSALFPLLKERSKLLFKVGEKRPFEPLSVGILFSGGPASGGHNVVAGLFDSIKKFHPESKLYGFLNGSSGLIEGKSRILNKQEIDLYRNQGGFDLLGTGRTKIEKPEQFQGCYETIEKLKLDGVVIVGGDDSNTNAAYLAQFLREKGSEAAVVGVPKTIDGDLKNRFIEASFGFDSAAKTYSELVGNVCRDAKSQGKYYFFIKLMGRTASHLVLETALRTTPNLSLISEEALEKGWSLKDVVSKIADLIMEREAKGLHHGVILIPEGIIEFLSDMKLLVKALTADPDPSRLSLDLQKLWEILPKETQMQLLLERDPHGNVQVSKIETERLLIALVKQELKARQEFKGSFSAQPLFFGYEGRSCLPTNFDASYCYALGVVASVLLRDKRSGYMATVAHLALPVPDWAAAGAPLVSMMSVYEKRGEKRVVIQKGLVDLDGAPFRAMKEAEAKGRLEDAYRAPGPIQFYGELADDVTRTLQLELASKNRLKV